MGLESPCTMRIGRRAWPGRAHLESESLLFRGDGTRLVIPFKSITAVDARDGTLRVTHTNGTASFSLGAAAARWAAKIRNPRSLLDKLGVKPGLRASVIGVKDEVFLARLADRTDDVSLDKPRKESDLIFFATESRAELSKLRRLRESLRPNGAIWVVHRKGKEASIKDIEVFAAAKASGLVDTKVVSFSATHTAEKLVVPLNQRRP